MSWTKLDDLWGEQIEQAMPDEFADRWHYLQLIQYCSRVTARDGLIPTAKAQRVSDHPDPRGAMTRLADLGLVVDLGKSIKLIRAEQHVISEAKQNETERKREDQRRSRSHREGDHELCVPGNGDKPKDCHHALQAIGHVTGDTDTKNPRDIGEEQEANHSPSGDSHLTVTGDVGTGRDGPGRREVPEDLEDSVDPETGEISSTPAPGPAELFGDAPVDYTPTAYDAGHWREPAPVPPFARRSN